MAIWRVCSTPAISAIRGPTASSGHSCARTTSPRTRSTPWAPMRSSSKGVACCASRSESAPANSSVTRIVHRRLDRRPEILRDGVEAGDAVIQRPFHDGGGDGGRYLADAGERRIQRAGLQVFLADEVREGPSGGEEHRIRYARGPGEDRAEPDAGKNIGVVALARPVEAPAPGHRLEGAAAGEDGAAVAPRVGLFGGALGPRGGIGEGKDDRPRVDAGHQLDDLAGERPRRSGGSDQNVGAVLFHGAEEVGGRTVGGIVHQCFRYIGALAGDEALAIHEADAAARIPFRHTLLNQ